MKLTDTLLGWFGRSSVPASPPIIHPPSPRADSGGIGFNHTAMLAPSAFGGMEAADGIETYKDIASFYAVNALFESGWLTGVVDAAISQVIGDGLRANVKADIDLLGWTPEQGADFAKQVERLFAVWTENPQEFDYSGRQNFAQFQRAALRAYFGQGEALAIHPVKKRTANMFASKAQLLDTSRLQSSNLNTDECDGIFYKDGAAHGVIVSDRDPASLMEDFNPKRIAFRSRSGKPLASLVFDHLTPQQRRGITPLMPVLRLIKQYEALHGASLATVQLQTLLAIAITSGADSEDVLAALSNGDSDNEALANYSANKLAWYRGQGAIASGSGIGGNVPVTHLLPGEQLDLKSLPNGGANLAEFSRLLKLEITRALGVPYSLTGDYDGATYSSVRMEQAVNWLTVLHRRKNIIGSLCNDVFSSFLEEVIIRGLVTLPGGIEQFYSMRPAFRVEWRGPSMPQADEGKSAKASKERLAIGTTSLAYECAAIGIDWQENLEQRKREKDHAERLGLPDPHLPDDSDNASSKTAGKREDSVQHKGQALTYQEALAALSDLEERMEASNAELARHPGKRVQINKDRTAIQREIDELEAAIEEYQS